MKAAELREKSVDALKEELEKAKENATDGGLTGDGKRNLSGMNEDELESQLHQLKGRQVDS